MGGIGKTTLARVVCDAIRRKFDACCFLANVREDSERFGLVFLQKKLLSCLQLGEPQINDSYDGVKVIRNFLCHKKVLIVLDDVNHGSQLDNLAKNKEWFGAWSKVIITTRNINLLTQYEQFEKYEVGILDRDESLKLLCQKAFEKDEPEQGYLDLSNEVIKYACGLPLALEVLGSSLHKRDQDEWIDTLGKLRQNLHKDIFSPLRISYDGLEYEEYKIIFLDIACFFNGKEKFDLTTIFEICGLPSISGIKVLIEKSLLSASQSNSNSRQNEEGQDMHDRLKKMRRDIFLPGCSYDYLLQEASKEYLYMHDLLQEMGRNIVLQESPIDVGRRSRLWYEKDIDLVLKGNKGTETIQSIVGNQFGFESNWHPDCFSKMPNLRLLDLNGVNLSHNLNSLPSTLKFLRWDHCGLEYLPSMDQLYELGSLQLGCSKIRKLWNGTPFLDKLRIVNLSGSNCLIETSDFSGTPNLEKLLLDFCQKLVRVHESLGQLKKLVVLNLKCCLNLVTLPSYLEMNKLEVFILGGCSVLERLPEFGENMTSLYFLDVESTRITEIPPSIIHLVNLKYFDLSYCKRLESIPKLPSNLIICASYCPLLKPKSALRRLIASCVSKGPIHLFYDSAMNMLCPVNKIPTWFGQWKHRRSKGTLGEVVTITANIPCDIADNKGECWGIAVCLGFQCLSKQEAWESFSINWKFQDYCHSIDKKRRRTRVSKDSFVACRLYIGFYPVDEENCRPHPSGEGSQFHLTLSFPITNPIAYGCEKRRYGDLEIVDCRWQLTCMNDFDASNASSSDSEEC